MAMKTIWKILIAILLVAGTLFIWRAVTETPAEIQEEAENISRQAGLPYAVAEKRESMALAAKNKDYVAFAALADKESFSYTFGGSYPGGFEAYLRDNESATAPLDKAYKLLSFPHIKQNGIYTWPAFFAKEAKDWTSEDIKMMRELYSDEDVEGFRVYGSYIGYRLGIRENGSWIYFISGD
jgi:hypothetical protein